MRSILHHVALSTGNLDRMAAFYETAFGFERVGDEFSWRETPEIDRVLGLAGSAARSQMFRAGGCYVELFEYAAPPPRNDVPLRPNDRGYTHFAIDVADVRAEMERLRPLGMTFATDVPLSGDGITAVYGYDPDGNVIELQQLAEDHPMAIARLATAL